MGACGGASEANQHGDDASRGRGGDAPAERAAPVARLAIDDMDVSWGW